MCTFYRVPHPCMHVIPASHVIPHETHRDDVVCSCTAFGQHACHTCSSGILSFDRRFAFYQSLFSLFQLRKMVTYISFFFSNLPIIFRRPNTTFVNHYIVRGEELSNIRPFDSDHVNFLQRMNKNKNADV